MAFDGALWSVWYVSGLILAFPFAALFVWLFNMLVVMPLQDPLRKLPGNRAPPFQSHFNLVMDAKRAPLLYDRWIGQFGKTFRYHGFGRHDLRLMSFDFRVLSHILKSPLYEKPRITRVLLSKLVGQGIFTAEGEDHKFQRKLIGPAFTVPTLRNVTPIIFNKAEALRDRWDDIITESGEKSDSAQLNLANWMSRACFDIVGAAGFDYDFHAIRDETERVYLAYRHMFDNIEDNYSLFGLLRVYYPVLDDLFPNAKIRAANASMAIIREAGAKLMVQKKARILAANDTADECPDKDILSLLIKANMTNDAKTRLSDEGLTDQCSVFLLVGSDTVSLAITWCLYHLSLHPEMQGRLREEILSIPHTRLAAAAKQSKEALDDCGSTDSGFEDTSPIDLTAAAELAAYSHQSHWEALEELPYLETVVREALRLCPPIHSTIRVAMADDHIPISEPMTLSDGTELGPGDTFAIRKGSVVHIPLEGINHSRELYGDDFAEFKPDRWFDLREAAKGTNHPGVSSLMTFGIGPHACLGNRMSMAEMKIIIATILPRYQFIPVPGVKIGKTNTVLTRPHVVGKYKDGVQLPIIVQKIHS